jgi:hypothetical protein
MPAVFWVGLLFALAVSLSGWRLPFPARELATMVAAICLVWIGVGEDGWLAFFGLLLPFTLVGWKLPSLLDTGGVFRGSATRATYASSPKQLATWTALSLRAGRAVS